MGLRCTVLGHAWSEPRIEREREESDAEVVTTVREYKECKRCGAREVLGENVEVTALESTDDADDGADADGAEGPAEDDAAIIEDAETGERTVVDDSTADAAETVGDDDAAGDANAAGDADDGAVILDAEDDSDGGEWPDPGPTDDETADIESRPWPDAGRDDSPPEERTAGDASGGFGADDVAADPSEERVADDVGAGPSGDHEAGDAGADPSGDRPPDGSGTDDESGSDGSPGVTAEAGDHADDAGEPSTTPDDDVVPPEEAEEVEILAPGEDDDGSPDEVASAGQSGDPEAADSTSPPGDEAPDPVDPAEALSAAADQGADDDPVEPSMRADVEIEVYCPNCGFVDDSSTPSLRGGDSCPQCQRAYLAERER